MSDDPKVETSEIAIACPRCAHRPATLVSIGDPENVTPPITLSGAGGTVTLSTFLAFFSCKGCGHSWHLSKEGSS